MSLCSTSTGIHLRCCNQARWCALSRSLELAMGIDRALEVLAAGPLTLVQDLGRVGLAAVGVGRSGAADRGAFRLGARLLAQPYTAAALEVTFGGLSIRAQGTVMLALT